MMNVAQDDVFRQKRHVVFPSATQIFSWVETQQDTFRKYNIKKTFSLFLAPAKG